MNSNYYSCLMLINYFTPFWVFRPIVSWWLSTGVLVTASLLKSQGFSLLFWPILIMQSFGCFPLVVLFPNRPVHLSIICWLYRAYRLPLVSPSFSCSIVFFISLTRSSTYPSFRFLSVWPNGQLGRKIPLFGRFTVFCWLSQDLVLWLRLGDPFVSQNLREHFVSYFKVEFCVLRIPFIYMVKF